MKNDSGREQRLKAALRDNLRRRKAQTRGRAETPPRDEETAEAATPLPEPKPANAG